jgi:hypothetical protein
MYGPIRTETTARSLLYVPKRYFMHGKKNFFPLHLRKKIKKWNSNFTFINVPCKFQKDRPKKVAMGINGLKHKLIITVSFQLIIFRSLII